MRKSQSYTSGRRKPIPTNEHDEKPDSASFAPLGMASTLESGQLNEAKHKGAKKIELKNLKRNAPEIVRRMRNSPVSFLTETPQLTSGPAECTLLPTHVSLYDRLQQRHREKQLEKAEKARHDAEVERNLDSLNTINREATIHSNDYKRADSEQRYRSTTSSRKWTKSAEFPQTVLRDGAKNMINSGIPTKGYRDQQPLSYESSRINVKVQHQSVPLDLVGAEAVTTTLQSIEQQSKTAIGVEKTRTVYYGLKPEEKTRLRQHLCLNDSQVPGTSSRLVSKSDSSLAIEEQMIIQAEGVPEHVVQEAGRTAMRLAGGLETQHQMVTSYNGCQHQYAEFNYRGSQEKNVYEALKPLINNATKVTITRPLNPQMTNALDALGREGWTSNAPPMSSCEASSQSAVIWRRHSEIYASPLASLSSFLPEKSLTQVSEMSPILFGSTTSKTPPPPSRRVASSNNVIEEPKNRCNAPLSYQGEQLETSNRYPFRRSEGAYGRAMDATSPEEYIDRVRITDRQEKAEIKQTTIGRISVPTNGLSEESTRVESYKEKALYFNDPVNFSHNISNNTIESIHNLTDMTSDQGNNFKNSFFPDKWEFISNYRLEKKVPYFASDIIRYQYNRISALLGFEGQLPKLIKNTWILNRETYEMTKGMDGEQLFDTYFKTPVGKSNKRRLEDFGLTAVSVRRTADIPLFSVVEFEIDVISNDAQRTLEPSLTAPGNTVAKPEQVNTIINNIALSAGCELNTLNRGHQETIKLPDVVVTERKHTVAAMEIKNKAHKYIEENLTHHLEFDTITSNYQYMSADGHNVFKSFKNKYRQKKWTIESNLDAGEAAYCESDIIRYQYELVAESSQFKNMAPSIVKRTFVEDKATLDMTKGKHGAELFDAYFLTPDGISMSRTLGAFGLKAVDVERDYVRGAVAFIINVTSE